MKKISTKKAIQTIISLFSEELISPAKCIIHYGSKARDRDFDLLIVTRSPVSWRHCTYGRLDILTLTFDRIVALLKLMDPLVTEPVLNGKVVFGSKKIFAQLKSVAQSCKPTDATCRYLQERACEEFLNCGSFLRLFKQTNQKSYLLWALTNLSYAFTYAALSNDYLTSKREFPLSFSEVLSLRANQPIGKVWVYLKRCKINPQLLDENKITLLAQVWQSK